MVAVDAAQAGERGRRGRRGHGPAPTRAGARERCASPPGQRLHGTLQRMYNCALVQQTANGTDSVNFDGSGRPLTWVREASPRRRGIALSERIDLALAVNARGPASRVGSILVKGVPWDVATRRDRVVRSEGGRVAIGADTGVDTRERL